ncbi:MAG: metalloregulator ArsR/SmtB family transcription factor [Clostridia bacterium]|nr:metalloregulator ArsR/SmtB family transcription factor [Clostridia bacterium]
MNERTLQLQADLLKALAHPTRLRILEYLRSGERCVCEITEQLELEQANVSQHLAVLKRQDLVSSRKDGLRMLYRINYPEIYELLETVKRILHLQARATVAVLEEVG